MRTYQHIIDTKALKHTFNSIPDHWVIRDLSERDYGIDLMVEIFNESGEDEYSHTVFEATGWICYLQIKGTNKKLSSKKGIISFQIDKKALLYVEKFSTPFILLRVCTLENEKQIYFVWLQRYIAEKLDFESPNWRDENKKSYAFHLPIKNSLPCEDGYSIAKIEKIARRMKYVEESVEFLERYLRIEYRFQDMINPNYVFTNENFNFCVEELKRIKNLSSLLNFNDCCIRKQDIETLIEYIIGIRDKVNSPKSLKDFPSNILCNLDLLSKDNYGRIAVEEHIAGTEEDTTY